MIIHSYENNPRADACIDYVRNTEVMGRVEKLFLLPIPSSKDGKVISGTNVYIFDILDDVDASSLVVGYGLPVEFVAAATRCGGNVFDVSLDEEFLLENAELTALATLGIILTTAKKAPADISVGVVGYGRIGKRLARQLLFHGAKVRVYTSSDDVRLDLCECGIETRVSTINADLSGLDMLVNTAPAEIFDVSSDRFPRDLRIIDLASGNNFSDLQVEKYPSIPAKMFPYTAGIAWGKSIERYVEKNIPRKGG